MPRNHKVNVDCFQLLKSTHRHSTENSVLVIKTYTTSCIHVPIINARDAKGNRKQLPNDKTSNSGTKDRRILFRNVTITTRRSKNKKWLQVGNGTRRDGTRNSCLFYFIFTINAFV